MASNAWNPTLETMPRDELRSLYLREFRERLPHAYEIAPFYRAKLDEAGQPGGLLARRPARRVEATVPGDD